MQTEFNSNQGGRHRCSVVSGYEHYPMNSANNLQHLFPISSPPYDPIQSNQSIIHPFQSSIPCYDNYNKHPALTNA